MRSLPIMGGQIHSKLLKLSETQDIKKQFFLVEDVCACILAEMRQQGYTSGESDFLMDHIPEIMERIESPEIRARGVNMVF